MTERPTGQRYSHLYLEPGNPVYESKRLQKRVSAFFASNFSGHGAVAYDLIEQEIGVSIPYIGDSIDSVTEFLRTCSTDIFLDSITVICRALTESDERYGHGNRSRSQWLTFIQRAFSEENSKFEVDVRGGVHPRVDAEFNAQRIATVKGLGDRRYIRIREHFEHVHEALAEIPPATNRAIRESYLANEEALKTLSPGATFETKALPHVLNPILESVHSGPELISLRLMVKAIGDFIAASQQYRHAQGKPTDPQASMETAVLMISTATFSLRWLLALDQAVLQKADPNLD